MLTKARFVAGDPDLGREAWAAIQEVLYASPPADGLRERLLAMRRKLEEKARGDDVKRGFGGIVDVEFLAEYLRLATATHAPLSARTRPSRRSPPPAARGSSRARTRGAAHGAAVPDVGREPDPHRVGHGAGPDPGRPLRAGPAALRLGYDEGPAQSAGDALLEEYRYHTARTRDLFTSVLSRV